jgi:hypothetical protein
MARIFFQLVGESVSFAVVEDVSLPEPDLRWIVQAPDVHRPAEVDRDLGASEEAGTKEVDEIDEHPPIH